MAQTNISIADAKMVLEYAMQLILDIEESFGFDTHEKVLDPREITEAVRFSWRDHFTSEMDTGKMRQLF